MTGPMLPQGPPDPTQTPNAAQQVQNNQATSGPVPPQVSAPVPGAQDMGGPQAAPQAPSTIQVPIPIAQRASRLASIGHFVTGMSNPNATPTQKMFQSIFRGALAGMGTAGENAASPGAGSPYAAIGRGAAAASQQRQQDAQRQQQAQQQQFENDLKTKQEQREQTGFETEQQVRKAQLAQANAETMRTNMQTQGESLKVHQDVVDADKNRISTFEHAGVEPVFRDIPESQMTDTIKNSAGASSLDWRHTGVKMGVDANGQPTYEYTLSAYDPNKPVPLSQATVDQWKEDGLFKYHPEYEDVAKAGKTLTVGQFTSLDSQAQNYSNQNLAKTKNDLDIKKDQAAINRDNATTAHEFAETSHVHQEMKDEALGKTQAAQFDNALTELNKVGGDFDKLQPSSRVVIAESMNKMVPALTAEYKDVLNSNDPEAQQKAGDILGQIQNITSLGQRALGSIAGTSPDPKVSEAVSRLKGSTPDQIATALSNPNITPEQKVAIYKGLGLTPPPLTSPDDLLTIQKPDGNTTTITRQEYDEAKSNPSVQTDAITSGKIVSAKPAAPPKTPEQSLAGMNLTAGNSQ